MNGEGLGAAAARNLALVASLALATAGPACAGAPQHWTEAFEASPAAYELGPELQKMMGAHTAKAVTGTVRFTLTLSSGGSAVRVRISNEEGDGPLTIGAASVALAGARAGETAGQIKPLTFHGLTSITLPAGAPALSDPILLPTRSLDRLAVSIYLPNSASFSVLGGGAMSVGPGDQTRSQALGGAQTILGRPLVSGVGVASDRSLPVVVALGDSITDGLRAKPEMLHGYPEELARRFAQSPVVQQRSVVNAGIGGNRVIAGGWGPSALGRLDRDVFRIKGVTHLILLEGINDIGMSGRSLFGENPAVSADELIAGDRQIIARAHAQGIKVLGGTLTPFEGAKYYTPEKEQVREAVNRWIRTSHEFDAVIDFEAALRDPINPRKLRSDLDSGDHLHPNALGYKTMGDAIGLDLFR
jgi:lysophospholipase L1-like esterase